MSKMDSNVKSLLIKIFLGICITIQFVPAKITQVHPSYRIVDILPSGWDADGISEFDWLPDGRLVVINWGDLNYNGRSLNVDYYGNAYQSNGGLHLLSGVKSASGPGGITVETIATGLNQPMGLEVIGNDIFVHEQTSASRILKFTNSGNGWNKETFAEGWASADTCFHWHSLPFSLERIEGSFYLTLASMLQKWQTTDPACFPTSGERGVLIKVDTTTKQYEIVSKGLRSMAGMTKAFENELFLSDNQGDWRPNNFIINLRPGRDYGHRSEGENNEISPSEMSPPAVYCPHGKPCICPMRPLHVKEGLYQGQLLIGENTRGGINRYFLENIGGEWQGCVWEWSDGMMAAHNQFNPHTMTFADDGKTLILGSGGDQQKSCEWCPWWGGRTKGLLKMVPTNQTAFEMLAVRSTGSDGFEIEFTEAVGNSATNAGNYTVRTWTTRPERDYGAGNHVNQRNLNVTSASIVSGSNNTKVKLDINGLQAGSNAGKGHGHVVYINMPNVRSAGGDNLWVSEVWYTLNQFGPGRDPILTTSVSSTETKDQYKVEMRGKKLILEGTGTKVQSIKIFDFSGRNIFSQLINNQNFLTLPYDLKVGVYTTIIRTESKDIKQKMVVF